MQPVIERDGDIVRRSVFQDGKMYNETIQEVSHILDHCAALRNERAGADKFKKAMVAKHLMHSACLPVEFVAEMRNGQCCTDGKSYDLSSPDREEIQRAMIHVQLCHPQFLTVDAKVFGKRRAWE